MPLKNTSPALMTIFRFSAFICSAAGYLALNVKCFRVPLGNINCFLFCSVFFFLFVSFVCLFVFFFFLVFCHLQFSRGKGYVPEMRAF